MLTLATPTLQQDAGKCAALCTALAYQWRVSLSGVLVLEGYRVRPFFDLLGLTAVTPRREPKVTAAAASEVLQIGGLGKEVATSVCAPIATVCL